MLDPIYAKEQFRLDSRLVGCTPYGFGHINSTYLVVTETGRRYILQGINRHVFADTEGLMRNIAAVTRHIGAKQSDPRGALHLVPTLDGEDYYTDANGEHWRMYDFVEGSLCLQQPETADDFYQSAVAFGTFQHQLADFPAETLCETIPNFHNTPSRYAALREAVERDVCGRAATCEYEIREYLSREKDASALTNMLSRGELPLRVTHNDTKLNNAMLDETTRKPLCVIDLDTVMPGLMAYDFGDSIRFGASTAAEDEQDLSRVSMDIELYRTFTRGFVGVCDNMTDNELLSLPLGAKLMTLECGARFLTDYLSGDVYFAVHRGGHNLDRCRTQLRLVQDMEAKWDEMNAIVLAEREASRTAK